MKKYYVTMFVATLCTSAGLFAQDAPAKKYFLGGTAGFSSTTHENTVNISTGGAAPVYVTSKGTNSLYTIAPELGFFIRKNTALGIKIGYNYSGENNSVTYNSIFASPFVRFIVPLWTSRFSVYNDLGISAGYSKGLEGLNGGLNGDSRILNLGAFYEPGLQFRLKNNINLMATLGNLFNYNYQQKKVTGIEDRSVKATNTNHYLVINSDFFALNSFRLGVNFLF